ncbi:MAG: helix-turn-helix domain-containing protein [Syntrophales bacterium]
MENAELLTISEMAKRLKVPLSWLYARTRIKDVNTIPHVRIGKYIRFNEAEVMTWLKHKYSDDV